MKHRRLIVSALALPALAVVLHAASARPPQNSPDPAFVREFMAGYLQSIAERREVQDRDLVDGRGWARAIWLGKDEKDD